MQITIGADPELFVMQSGRYMSAHDLVPGTKQSPHTVQNGAVQVDGMALEFNIDPADTEDGFVFNLSSVMQQLYAMVPDYEVVSHPVATFDQEYIDSQPAEAQALGCDPDYNAWTAAVNDKPEPVRPMRTAAGHVHIGYTNGAGGEAHFSECCAIVRQLDFYLGLPSMLYDTDQERRELYGKAGAFRPKPYGLEYRVLSNRWLEDERLMRWVFRAVHAALSSLQEGNFLVQKYGDIQRIINESDVAAAKEIIAAEMIPTPEVQ